MACYHPRRVFFPPDGGRPHFRDDMTGAPDQELWTVGYVPCRRCIGCRGGRSREWSIRLTHEAQLHRQKCFVTLTYDRDHVPRDGSVSKRDLQLFMKRVRKELGDGIRFFGVGEYGGTTMRPHYHVCLYGTAFLGDRTDAGKSHTGHRMYASRQLEDLWGMGLCTVQDLTVETASYCAQYSMKKIGARAQLLVTKADGTQVTVRLKPEFLLMSRNPGIGRGWFERFSGDVYSNLDDSKVVLPGGQVVAPPSFYDRMLRDRSQADYDRVKAARRAKALRDPWETVVPRIGVREEVERAKVGQKERSGV